MKKLPILVLLSSAVLLCSAAPVLEPVTCSEDSGAAMARLAMYHINEHHDHGYKFRLKEIQGNKVEKADSGCNAELQLDLLETKCHVVNPKHFEDCELRGVAEREVMANCTVMMTVKNSDAKVTKYDCETRQVKTNMEMMTICPDCPTLHSLKSPEGIKSVNEGVKKINQNTTNQRYYILQEVGRIRSGYMMKAGMSYFAEFALVETHCPMGSRIIPEACKPLCPDRARHAVCSSSYSSTDGLQSVECEYYPPSNTTTLGPGEHEPACRHHGHPSHAGGHGHRPHAGGHGHHHNASSHEHHHHAGSHEHHHHAGSHEHHHHAGSHGHHPNASGHGCHPHTRGQGRQPNTSSHGNPAHDGGRGPPPHAGGHGTPAHDGGRGPPPHAGGRGTPAHDAAQRQDKEHRPPFSSYRCLQPFRPCHGSLTNFDPALHPICPWPHPEANPDPKLSQSRDKHTRPKEP